MLESEKAAEACDEVEGEEEESVEDGVHTTRPASLSRGELGSMMKVVGMPRVERGAEQRIGGIEGNDTPRRTI